MTSTLFATATTDQLVRFTVSGPALKISMNRSVVKASRGSQSSERMTAERAGAVRPLTATNAITRQRRDLRKAGGTPFRMDPLCPPNRLRGAGLRREASGGATGRAGDDMDVGWYRLNPIPSGAPEGRTHWNGKAT